MGSYVLAQPTRAYFIEPTYVPFIFKDTRDMNIYLIQMTAGQSDNNSYKSEHETAATLPE